MKAKHRRQIHLYMALTWLIPGAAASIIWARSLPWIVFMSWFSATYAALSAHAAETPVEPE